MSTGRTLLRALLLVAPLHFRKRDWKFVHGKHRVCKIQCFMYGTVRLTDTDNNDRQNATQVSLPCPLEISKWAEYSS
jgi:hypothetical protein